MSIPSTSSAPLLDNTPLLVRCHGRTRIPTPHGEIFCHLYRNNHDQKEHLALVVDPAQNEASIQQAQQDGRMGSAPHLRSHTLDAVWHPQESEMERLVRGAYVNRLSPTCQDVSMPREGDASQDAFAPPLVRIHSECYTGETIGSQRCDCGEQLDEALRQICQSTTTLPDGTTVPARGVIVYMRQEGRGIGLLDKLCAYNLQDMGHDTVSANIMLGHLPDARKYDISSEILRDLGVGACRLLTNNPEKMQALTAEGIEVTERVPMVPRMWQARALLEEASPTNSDDGVTPTEPEMPPSMTNSLHTLLNRSSGATLIGGTTTDSQDLDRYLRTKVERMGHLLVVPNTEPPPTPTPYADW